MAFKPTPLHYAVGSLHVNEVVGFIRNGAYVDATKNRNQTALHCAARRGTTKLASILLSNGAKYNMRDDEDRTALISLSNTSSTV